MNDFIKNYLGSIQHTFLFASILLSIVLVLNFLLFNAPVIIDDAQKLLKIGKNALFAGSAAEAMTTDEIKINLLVEAAEAANNEMTVKYSSYHTMTAYNSEVGQTDDSPCITANGFNVCEHGIEDTIAANFLKFGTKVRIPELFGDRVFVVRDRMNKKYSDRVDIWMLNKVDARQFGVRYAKIEVLAD